MESYAFPKDCKKWKTNQYSFFFIIKLNLRWQQKQLVYVRDQSILCFEKMSQWTLLVRLWCEDAAYVYNMALVYFFDSFGYLTVLLLFWVYKYGLLRTQNSLYNTREKSVQLWERNDNSMICDSFRSEQSCSFMLTTDSRKCFHL